MKYAPIALFVYNRPWHTKKTLQALKENTLSKDSELFIFMDGPKDNESIYSIEDRKTLKEILQSEDWCGKVNYIYSDTNKGLADSIINGVTEIVNKYGKIIVLEDDIVTSPHFLEFMNNALDLYKDNSSVMHISGFMYPSSKNLPETFFFNVPLCWGWATWKRAWDKLNIDTEYLYNYFNSKSGWQQFNKFGGDYLQIQLENNFNGIVKTWFIKWHASVLINNGFCLFPGKSLVNNIGFDNSGTNCESNSKYNTDYNNKVEVLDIPFEENKDAYEIINKFYYPSISLKQRINTTIVKFLPKSFLNLSKSLFVKALKRTSKEINLVINKGVEISNSSIDKTVKISDKTTIGSSDIGRYTYISSNCNISFTEIGSFCSIGPNLLCGWGIHPTNGLSTSPTFYSTWNQNGFTLAQKEKIIQRKKIIIGNDVFIGANVTILDGIKIGDGAVIGAGSVVTKDVPPYAIAGGVDAKIIKYRFSDEQIQSLLRIKWWNFQDINDLKNVEKLFFDIDGFIEKYDK